MKKIHFKLKDGSARIAEPDELISFASISRKFGMLIFVLGILVGVYRLEVMFSRGYGLDLGVFIALFIIYWGWELFRYAPRPDENTIKDGFRTYKGRASAKDIKNYQVFGSYLWLLDETGNKVARVKSVEEKGE